MEVTMARVCRLGLLAALAFVMAVSPLFAQSAPPPARRAPVAVTLYELVLRDGSRLYGTIEHEEATEVSFRTQSGVTLTAARADILSLRKVNGVLIDGGFERADPTSTRLFFGPTGRSLKRGQTYLGVYEFLLPFVQVGVTDRFSIGGGTPLIFGFDDGNRPFWVTPKLQVYNGESTQLAVGLFHGMTSDGDGGGIAYGVGTHGTAAGSFTIGAGMGYATDAGKAGVVMIGGEKSIRRNMKLVTENYVWKGGDGVASAGIRFFGERLSADLALGIPIGADSVFAFPVVNFVYLF